MDRGDLFSLAICGGYVKRAFNDWSEKVATLVDDPDLIDWPLEDPLTCMAIAFMRHLAIQTVKKWREKAGSDDDQADWWKGEVSE